MSCKILCFLTVWFPDVFTFTYSHTIFLFNLAMTEMGSADYYPMAIFVAVVFLGPFGVMVSVDLTTCIHGILK